MFRKRFIFAICLVLFIPLYAQGRSMNYQFLADAETQSWQAYYQKDTKKLLQSLSAMLGIQFDIENAEKTDKITAKFAQAMTAFAGLSQDAKEAEYNQSVLPLLTDAYTELKTVIHARWDANAAAQADLSWWIARRNDATLNPEIVSEKMAKLYFVLYGTHDEQRFIRAAYLRSVAGRYRDQCQDKWGGIQSNDWLVVNALLQNAYQELALGINANKSI